ncbi:nuclear transport factor 2 family protein [Mesorhizobium sp.]|uniref:nuclear transport factor 2 family protein n=1 Tax=Mesorhizobium sp. TaxID=1871066 RepID=UPI000FE786CE|nr:nuclear transport factor 2 family protein [Mesorhizobium sp.]RWB34995.1 MAG: nuclear transport factor 2 family protein [Mesorhizobium sp.]RWC36172.1 MAG: nuclear transport factor 2 family protein [Mesorhizobium sp.]RWD42020.1 MAG: nuclear transport factor 2 family protein [Mesorhizobium sp.]RWE56483.1 MAG: nuclear transport factor 2 family protein [Mesorhizobium sp.]RWE65830.1 MAG: nuclear transport factor 2 family protein [Mesorhizobium sp.]
MTRLASLAAGALLAVSAAPANGGPQEDRNIQLIKDYYAAYATGNPEAVRPFLAPDVVWRIPGHHPLAGDKRGPEEVVAFFRGLADGKFRAEPIFFQAQGDLVVDIHRGWSNVGSGPEIDQLYALMFRIKDGKIAEAQNFLTDMYQSDAFYWTHYPLKPLPGRLAADR